MIEAHSLTRRFGTFTAVSQLSLKVPNGSILALLGPNGAGKTTTVRMLAGLLAPTEGNAIVGGYDIRKEPDAVRACTGLVTDVPGLYEQMNVVAYLDFFGRLAGMPAASRLRRSAARRHSSPYSSPLPMKSNPVRNLPGAHEVEIARLLAA